MKHTHRGHCQACGAVQAVQVRGGTIALHGYEVVGGYFSGTCSGSKQEPLEQDRSYTDRVIESCRLNAIAADTLAGELAAGVVNPLRVSLGSKYEPKANRGRGGYVEQWVAWSSDVPTEYQRKAQRERDIRENISRAEFMREHANRLQGLADRVHGQPLLPAEPEAPEVVFVGVRFKVNDKEFEILRTKVCGLGMRAIYTEVKRLHDGAVYRMSTTSVRRYIREGKACK